MNMGAIKLIRTKALVFFLYNSFITHVPSYAVRHWYLRNMLRISIGKNSSVHMGCFFSGRHIVIGDNTVVNRGCYLDGRVGVTVGNNVSISPESYILSLDHDPNSASFSGLPGPVYIDDYVWIGVRAIILPGVHLPRGCVVGAGAVVTKDPEPCDIVAGVPAKKIGTRNGDLHYSLKYSPYFNSDYFNFDQE